MRSLLRASLFVLLMMGETSAEAAPASASSPELHKIKAQVLRLLFPGHADSLATKAQIERFLSEQGVYSWKLAPWRHRPGRYLFAAVEKQQDQGEVGYQLTVALFKLDKDKPKLEARSARSCDCSGVGVDDLWLDQARYRISPAEVAIGVRVSWEQPMGPSPAEVLYLFRQVGSQLKLIADLSTGGETGDRDPNGHFDNVVVISKHRTRGFFDLRLRPRKAKNRAQDTIYRWNGEKYLSHH